MVVAILLPPVVDIPLAEMHALASGPGAPWPDAPIGDLDAVSAGVDPLALPPTIVLMGGEVARGAPSTDVAAPGFDVEARDAGRMSVVQSAAALSIRLVILGGGSARP